MAKDFTWHKLGVFILLFEATLSGLMVTYKYNFVAFMALFFLWIFSVLIGLGLSLKFLASKRLLPFIFFLLSFSPYLLFLSIDLMDKMPLRVSRFFSMTLLLIAPIGFIFGWLSLYWLSRHTKPQTTLNRTALFMVILWLITIPIALLGEKIVKHRETKDIAKSKQQAQKIINRLEVYHKEHAAYPESLTAVNVDKNMTYLPWFGWNIDYYQYNNSYRLEFGLPTGFINYYKFSSETNRWRHD